MKKIITRKLALVLMLSAMIFASAFSASAATIKHYYAVFPNNTVYQWLLPEKTTNPFKGAYRYAYGSLKTDTPGSFLPYFWVEGKAKVKQQNPDITKLNLIHHNFYKNKMNGKWSANTQFKMEIAGPGTYTANLSVYDLNTKKTTVDRHIFHVYTYTNPVKSFKIGKTDYARKFRLNACFVKALKKSKSKISIVPADGWIVKGIYTFTGSHMYGIHNKKAIKNNSTATIQKNGCVEVILYNKQAGALASVSVAPQDLYTIYAG